MFKIGDKVMLNDDGVRYLIEEYDEETLRSAVGEVALLSSFIEVKFDFFKRGTIPCMEFALKPFKEEFEEVALITTPMDISDADFDKPEKAVGKFEHRGRALGELVDNKEIAYGSSVAQTYDLMKIFLKKHYNEEKGAYIISDDLLKQILLQVRIIDKQNRIFNNPSQDLMEENTYNDIVGYSLIGGELTGR